MSSKNILLCDRCGSKILEYEGANYTGPARIYLAIGDYPDAAGGPSQEDERPIDLCSDCLAMLVRILLKNRTFGTQNDCYRANQALMDWGKTRVLRAAPPPATQLRYIKDLLLEATDWQHSAGCSGNLDEKYRCKCGFREWERKVKEIMEGE